MEYQQWIFGGIDTTTKKCFLVPVAQRDRVTLIPIVQQFILPGTLFFDHVIFKCTCIL